jgi:hypothetical protein
MDYTAKMKYGTEEVEIEVKAASSRKSAMRSGSTTKLTSSLYPAAEPRRI